MKFFRAPATADDSSNIGENDIQSIDKILWSVSRLDLGKWTVDVLEMVEYCLKQDQQQQEDHLNDGVSLRCPFCSPGDRQVFSILSTIILMIVMYHCLHQIMLIKTTNTIFGNMIFHAKDKISRTIINHSFHRWQTLLKTCRLMVAGWRLSGWQE